MDDALNLADDAWQSNVKLSYLRLRLVRHASEDTNSATKSIHFCHRCFCSVGRRRFAGGRRISKACSVSASSAHKNCCLPCLVSSDTSVYEYRAQRNRL